MKPKPINEIYLQEFKNPNGNLKDDSLKELIRVLTENALLTRKQVTIHNDLVKIIRARQITK